MLPSCRSCSVPESACGTICGAWRPTTRSRRKRQGAAPSTLPSNVSWPMTSGDHGLLHMVHDGFPVSVLGQCPLFWFQNQNQTVRSHPIAVLPLQSPKSHVCAGSKLTNRPEPIRTFPPRNTAVWAGVEIGRASCRERVCQYV